MADRVLEQLRELLLHPSIKGLIMLASLMWVNLVEHITIDAAYTLIAVAIAFGLDLILGMWRACVDPQMTFSLAGLKKSVGKAFVWSAFLGLGFSGGMVIDALRGEHEFSMSFWLMIAGASLVVATDGLSALEHLRFLTGGRFAFPVLERYLAQLAAGRYDALIAGVRGMVNQAAEPEPQETEAAPAG